MINSEITVLVIQFSLAILEYILTFASLANTRIRKTKLN